VKNPALISGLFALLSAGFNKLLNRDPKKRELKKYVRELVDADLMTKVRAARVMYFYESGGDYEALLPFEEEYIEG
jgi:hypothetical protein